MRKLVTIRNINEIKEHPNADLLELAVIDGWQCVVKKGEFKENESIIFFEIDSVLPIKEEFEFLRKSSYVKKDWLPTGEGFRLRTVKLRKEISQGLVIKLPDELKSSDQDLDFSEFFGVIKYDPPMNLTGYGIPRGSFPSFIPKTDQERIQNISIKQIKDCIDSNEFFEVTQKYDGSSITVFNILDDSKFKDEKYYGIGICSRNIYLKIDENEDNKFISVAKQLNLDTATKKLSEYLNCDIAVQGELCGVGIQNNHHSLPNYNIFIFDIYDINNQKYFDPKTRIELFNKLVEFGFLGNHVDIIHSEFNLPSEDRNDIIKLSEYKLPNGNENEGLVYKSHSRNFSFKAISNNFLLKEHE